MKKYLLMMLAASSLTQAATFNVSTTAELRVSLTTASSNGEDDTINLAGGTYKTTDDGEGAFTYLSNEINTLKITGSSPENVILSGDNTDQIFFNSYIDELKNGVLTIENVSLINANSTQNGGAIFSNQNNMIIKNLILTDNVTTGSFGGAIFIQVANIEIYDSKFERNSSVNGGGAVAVYSGDAVISGSSFSQNTTGSSYSSNNGGGAIQGRQGSTNTRTSSMYTGHPSSGTGGAIMGTVDADELEILNNIGSSGGGIYGSGTIKNSIIKGNMCVGACYGGGVFFSNGNVFNNIIENNSSEIVVDYEDRESGALYAGGDTFIINNLFIDNSTGASAYTGTFINNIFINNGAFDIKAANNSITTIKSNYIDTTKIQGISLKSNNIFGGNVAFKNESGGDYRLTSISDFINAGTTDSEGVTFQGTDLDGNARFSGGSVDIGPYEFQDYDGDGLENEEDLDDDNDGVLDTEDAFPLDATSWVTLANITFTDTNLAACVNTTYVSTTANGAITSLACYSKGIVELSGIENLTSLTSLSLTDNQIVDISDLAALTSLTHLVLWSNKITNLNSLADLVSLTHLELWANQINDISGLTVLTSLTHLYLGSNQISDITPLANLNSLNDLTLFSNQINDITTILSWSVLPNIIELYQNPISCIQSNNLDTREINEGNENYSSATATCAEDSDNDGIEDSMDAFPTNASASVDTDLDGMPDSFHENCDEACVTSSGLTLDLDDDNDGILDSDDQYPLEKNLLSFDVNGDGKVSLPIDGFIILRSMVGFPASALASDDDMVEASRTRDEMAQLLNDAKENLVLDINGDGKVSLPIDGFIILRHMVGFPASALASDEDMVDATRTRDEMKNYMSGNQ
jgi:Leucine-rich repeat (LRR) protein